MQIKNYLEVRANMDAGDIIAFGGKGAFSEVIKWSTRSTVSHIGVVLQSKLLINGTSQDGFFNQIIESTSYNNFTGVQITRLSERIATYEGEMWWLPLSAEYKAKLNKQKFYDFILHQQRKKYDLPQAIIAVLDNFDKNAGGLTHNKEDFSAFFCSELAAAGFKAGGIIKKINSSEVTPADLCSFKLYDKEYCQLKGKKAEIKGYNTLNPEGWGI